MRLRHRAITARYVPHLTIINYHTHAHYTYVIGVRKCALAVCAGYTAIIDSDTSAARSPVAAAGASPAAMKFRPTHMGAALSKFTRLNTEYIWINSFIESNRLFSFAGGELSASDSQNSSDLIKFRLKTLAPRPWMHYCRVAPDIMVRVIVRSVRS